ncbi:helix-turn-helix domain-containing protein [Clostridium saccharoperbutylacetonicum]
MSFGNNIKKCRLDKGINQKEFAKILGIPVSTLANYENDHREPKTEVLIKIADALLIPIDELLNAETTSFSSKLITSILQMNHITIVDASEEYGFKAISRDACVDVNSLKKCLEQNIDLPIEDQLKLINFWGKWGNEDDGIELEEFYHQYINKINKNPIISKRIKDILNIGATKNDIEKLIDLLEKYNFKVNTSNKNNESILSIYNNENPIITESESNLLPVYNEILNKINSYAKFIIEDELNKLKKD